MRQSHTHLDSRCAHTGQDEQDEDEDAWMKWSKDRVETYLAKRGRCSVLVKVNAELTELTTGHTTWGSYYTMNRIWKTYNLHIKGYPDNNDDGREDVEERCCNAGEQVTKWPE